MMEVASPPLPHSQNPAPQPPSPTSPSGSPSPPASPVAVGPPAEFGTNPFTIRSLLLPLSVDESPPSPSARFLREQMRRRRRLLALRVSFSLLTAAAFLSAIGICLWLIIENANYKGVVAVASTFTAAASFITVFEIAQHAAYYHKPIFQKQICRLLALVPIYGVCSLTSLISPRAGKYVDVLRDCYEAVTIYSFTWLILSYAEADANLSFSSFPETLANKPPLPHLRPLHLMMEPWKMGTPFIKKVQTGVLNYVVLRPITAVLGFLLEPLGKFTAGDVDPRNAYVYLALINSVSQAWALYCLIQLYRAVSADLTGVRLLAKFVCVKGLVFFTFWQGLLVALLLRLGLIQRALRPHTDTPAMLAVRIQNFLICCEMLFFSVAHAYAFSAAEFFTSSDAPSPSAGPTTAWSVLHALFDWSDLTRNMGAQVTYGAGLPLSELKRVVGARQRAAAARESAARGERDTVPLI